MRRARQLVFTAMILAASGASPRAQARPPRCGTVEVVDQNGKPIAGAEVTHHWVDPSTNRDPTGNETWSTNARGRVCEERLLEAGFIELHAPLKAGGWCAGFERMPYAGWRPGARAVTRLTLPVQRLPMSRWHGRIVDATGQPVPAAHVMVMHFYPAGTECSERWEDWYTTDAGGQFTLPPLPHGDLALEVAAKGFARQAFKVALPSAARDLGIDRGARWTGRVLDPGGGVITSCNLTLRTPDDIEVRSGCGANGFDLRAIPPGNSKLTIEANRHATLGRRRVWVTTVMVTANETRQDDVRWPPGPTLSGRVVMPDGLPVARAGVIAWSADQDRWFWEGQLETETAADGSFTFPNLAAGDWKVSADSYGKGGIRTITLDAAGTPAIELVVPPRKRRP